MIVRPARTSDLESVLVIADRVRQQYATYQSQFWNPAANAVSSQREFFTWLLTDPGHLFAVAITDDRVRGFVIATVVPTPPVYDPGGSTCLVDDFTVDEPGSWPEVGPSLLAAVRAWATPCGATQLVVVTAGADDPKRRLLGAMGLGLASEWWVGQA